MKRVKRVVWALVVSVVVMIVCRGGILEGIESRSGGGVPRRTVIIAPGGEPLTEIDSKNASSSGGVVSVDVDTLETPAHIGSNDIYVRDNSGRLEFSNNNVDWYDYLALPWTEGTSYIVGHGVTTGTIALQFGDDDVFRYNADTDTLEWYNGSSWGGIGGSISVTDDTTTVNDVDTIRFNPASGFSVTDDGGGQASVSSSSSWNPIQVSGQSDLDATGEEALEIVAGTGISLTTNTGASPQTLTVANTVTGDSDAIHDNVSGEIVAITEKASPVGADVLVIEDSEASNAKKRVQITNLPGGTDSDAIHDNVAGEIVVVTEKASPVSADVLLMEDSEASNAKKRVQIGNLPGGTDAAAIHDDTAGEIAAVTAKADPVAADVVLLEDSEASNAKKRAEVGSLLVGDHLTINYTTSEPTAETDAGVVYATGGVGGLDSNVLVLLRGESYLTDVSSYGRTITSGTGVSSGTDEGSPFDDGNDTYLFAGTAPSAQYIGLDNSDNAFDFGNGNWTIDFWIYPYQGQWYNWYNIAGYWGGSAGDASIRILKEGSPDPERFHAIVYISSTAYEVETNTITREVWQHVAVVRNGGNLTIYRNGTAEGTRSDLSTLSIQDTGSYFYVGSHSGSSEYEVVDGAIEEFRISDTARWTSNFSVDPPVRYDDATKRLSYKFDDSTVYHINDHAHVEADITDLDHTDADAIHDNVSGEIVAVTEKASPVSADVLVIEDSEASNAKKRLQIGNLPADSAAIHDDVAAEISAITEKTAIVGADKVLIEDSEASHAKKMVQVSNLVGGEHTLDLYETDESVGDDATITTLGTINQSGWGFLVAGDNEEYAQFSFTAAGAVTLIANSTNVANSSSDGNLCVYSSGSNGLTIENKLGAAKQIKAVIRY